MHLSGDERYAADSTPLFLFCCVAIRCNNELLRFLRLAKKKQQCTLNITQLRLLG